MKIQYLGHSSFLLTMGGVRIVTDPYGDVGFRMPQVRADVVTLSHLHYDHANTRAVQAHTLLQEAGSYRAGSVAITAVRRYHDEVQGRKRGEDLVFRFEGEGISLMHLGDLGERCTPEVCASIGRADILLLPVGGNYTIDAAEAKRYVEALSPAVVIPMHYRVPGLTVDIEDVTPFLSLFDKTERAGSTVEFTAEALKKGSARTRIILMERE